MMLKALNPLIKITVTAASAILILSGCQLDDHSPTNNPLGAYGGTVVGECGAGYDDVRQITVSNYTYIEDAPLDPTHPDNNFGGHDGGRAACKFDRRCDAFLIRLVQLNSLIPRKSKIISCSMYLYIAAGDELTGDKQVEVHRVFKPWVEGDGVWHCVPAPGEGCTFNKWDGWRAWGRSGAQKENDAGVPNEGDGTGYDCTATPMTITTVQGINTYPYVVRGYYKFDLNPQLIQEWLTTPHNEGILLRTSDPSSWVHLGTKEAPDGQRPYFVITYLPPRVDAPESASD